MLHRSIEKQEIRESVRLEGESFGPSRGQAVAPVALAKVALLNAALGNTRFISFFSYHSIIYASFSYNSIAYFISIGNQILN